MLAQERDASQPLSSHYYHTNGQWPVRTGCIRMLSPGHFGMAKMHQCGIAEGGWKRRGCLMNRSIPPLSQALLTALFLVSAAHGAVTQDPKPVHYTCADGTKLQATFSPPGTSMGSVKLVYAGSSTETTL